MLSRSEIILLIELCDKALVSSVEEITLISARKKLQHRLGVIEGGNGLKVTNNQGVKIIETPGNIPRFEFEECNSVLDINKLFGVNRSHNRVILEGSSIGVNILEERYGGYGSSSNTSSNIHVGNEASEVLAAFLLYRLRKGYSLL